MGNPALASEPALQPELLTEEEVARRYRVSVHSVRRWRREGRIAFLKVGRQVFFRPADLGAFEASREVLPPDFGAGRLPVPPSRDGR